MMDRKQVRNMLIGAYAKEDFHDITSTSRMRDA
jgi:hypothetical protein